MKVLVLEDDPGICYSLQLILEMAGDDSTLVDCGEDALEVLNREHFDVVLLDLNTNGMSAREFVESLNQMCRMRQLLRPRLGLISGSIGIEFEAQRLGVDFWIPKPFELDDINRQLQGFRGGAPEYDSSQVMGQVS